jgi:hypothetical protein
MLGPRHPDELFLSAPPVAEREHPAGSHQHHHSGYHRER